MMAIGDSLYQGVRSLTLAPGMPANSAPALVAEVLKCRFTVPDLPREILFNLEEIYRSPFPLATIATLPVLLVANTLQWRSNTRWSVNEAFDNVSVGSALIDSLYTDTYRQHWPKFKEYADKLGVSALPYEQIADFWYSLNVCFTLNPRHREEQQDTTQLQQVIDRRPRTLLVNIGSNEGLFSAAFEGNLEAGSASLIASRSKMEELARRLGDLPKNVERIVFNSLIRPRTATNLMPADSKTLTYPGDHYFDAYGPWMFSDQQPISGAQLKAFDDLINEQNAYVRSVLENYVGDRLVFVDLYSTTTQFDGKHYRDRTLTAGGFQLKNLPLSGSRLDMGGGLTGLDNMHPTVPGYAIIADAVLAGLGATARTDKEDAFRRDTLLQNPPPFLHERHLEVLAVATLLQNLGKGGIAAKPEQLRSQRAAAARQL